MPALSKKQIATLHEQLRTIKVELTRLLTLSEKSSDIVTLDQSRVGRLSRMDALQQQEMAKAGKQRQEQQLILVNRALIRLEENEYGYCLECDEVIAYSRLQIRPESEFCVACQNLQENL